MGKNAEIKSLDSLKPIESNLDYNNPTLKKMRDIVESTLKENGTDVKTFQKNLSILLKEKGYEGIKIDGKFGGQSLEAVRLFLNEYKGKSIQDAKSIGLKELKDSITYVNAEITKLQKEKDRKLKQAFEKAAKKAPEKEVLKANTELNQVYEQETKEKQKVISGTQKELKTYQEKVKKTIFNNQLIKTYLITNDKGEQIPVKISKTMDKDFDVKWGKNKLSFTGKAEDLPVSFDININKNFDYYDMSFDYYDMSIDLKKHNGVNYYIYNKVKKNGKDINQIYYSYEKNGKFYIGVVGFSFDKKTGEVKNYKYITKQVKNINHKFSEEELKEYQDEMYYIHILDFSWKDIENDTIVTYNNVDVATEEETYEELSKKYKDKTSLDGALKLLGADIVSDDELKKQFDIGVFDKEGIGTGDILGLLITKKGIEDAGLEGKLDSYYKLIKNGFISPYEVKNIGKDISKYPNVKTFNTIRKLQFFSDFDASGKIGDNTKMIWGEIAPYHIMKDLKEEQINEKIKELAELGGMPKDMEGNISPYVEKIFFWRGLNYLPVDSRELKAYLSGNKTLGEIKKETFEIQRKIQEKILSNIYNNSADLQKEFGSAKEFISAFEGKKKKTIDRLIAQLPENLRNNQTIIDRIKASIEYIGASALYVSNEGKPDTYGGALNYKVDWGIFDNLSLGVAHLDDGKFVPGISLSKNFKWKSKDGKISSGITLMLVNGVIPIASASAAYDFADSKLEKWDQGSKKIVTSIGTAFPVLFGSIGYNFGRAENVNEKNEKMSKALDKMLDLKYLKEGENGIIQIDITKYSGIEKQIASSINMMLKKMPMKGWTIQEKKQVLDQIKNSVLQNYENLNINSNEGTRLSEVGLIRAIIFPIPYIKWESIKAKYSLDNNTPKSILKHVKSGDFEKTKINNAKGLENYFKKLNIPGISFDGKHIVIDENSLPNGTMIGIDPKLDIQKKGGNILIGGNLDLDGIKVSKLSAAGKHANMIIFGDALRQTLKGEVYMTNFIGKDKDGKINENVNYTDKLAPISLIGKTGKSMETGKTGKSIETGKTGKSIETGKTGKSIETYIKENEEFKKIKEKFKKSELYKNIIDGVDGRIFNIKNEEFNKQYEELINFDRNYNYDGALKYVRNTMLAKRKPLSWFIHHRLGQKKLDEIRFEIDKILSSQDKNKFLQEKVIVETFIRQFFVDTNVKQKEGKNIGDKNTQKYMQKLSRKDFETKNLVGNWKYNRSAGFARALRDELFGKKHSTFNGKLIIKGETDMNRVLNEAKAFVDDNELPKWASNLTNEQREKLGIFYKIILANNKYINAEDKNGNKYFDKSTPYKTAEAEDIIAFPFTYKLGVDKHGHVPITGMVELVDRDGDGKITNNDFEKINDTKGLREYMFNILPPRVKDSLKKVIKNTYSISSINDDELRQLFVNKSLTKDGKKLVIDYDVALAKRAQCFNSTLILKNLKIKNLNNLKNKNSNSGRNEVGFIISSGEVYIKSAVSTVVKTNTLAGGVNGKTNSENNNQTNSKNGNADTTPGETDKGTTGTGEGTNPTGNPSTGTTVSTGTGGSGDF